MAAAAIEYRAERDFIERLRTSQSKGIIMMDFKMTADILRVTAKVLDAIARNLAMDLDRDAVNGPACKELSAKPDAMRMTADILAPSPVVDDRLF